MRNWHWSDAFKQYIEEVELWALQRIFTNYDMWKIESKIDVRNFWHVTRRIREEEWNI